MPESPMRAEASTSLPETQRGLDCGELHYRKPHGANVISDTLPCTPQFSRNGAWREGSQFKYMAPRDCLDDNLSRSSIRGILNY